MQTNINEAKNTLGNEKNRTQTGHKAGHTGEPIQFPAPAKREKSAARAGRDSVAYWKTRVKSRIVRGSPTPELYCRLFEGGREAWLCLNTSNRSLAAERARDHYLRMKGIGLPAMLAELRPDKRPERPGTVGEFIAAARKLCKVRARTLAQYETSLRRIVAGVCKLDGDASRFDYKTGGADAWREKIEAVRLDKLTPAGVEAWRISWAAEAEGEKDRTARQHSAATYIRNAKSLFAPDLLAVVRERVRLPDLLPFTGLSAPAASRRFVQTVDPRKLYAAAWRDLADTPDTLTAFLLLITAGLRRAEADLLPWSHLDLAATPPRVHVAATAYFLPKTEESAREIPLPADVAQFLRARRIDRAGAEFVLEGGEPRTGRRTNNYRAHAWAPLTKWLRAGGLATPTPLHEVRKLSGSLINAAAGLEAARRFLGHADVSTTSNSYVAAAHALVDLSTPSTPAQ